jgi:hypothetical protein
MLLTGQRFSPGAGFTGGPRGPRRGPRHTCTPLDSRFRPAPAERRVQPAFLRGASPGENHARRPGVTWSLRAPDPARAPAPPPGAQPSAGAIADDPSHAGLSLQLLRARRGSTSTSPSLSRPAGAPPGTLAGVQLEDRGPVRRRAQRRSRRRPIVLLQRNWRGGYFSARGSPPGSARSFAATRIGPLRPFAHRRRRLQIRFSGPPLGRRFQPRARRTHWQSMLRRLVRRPASVLKA